MEAADREGSQRVEAFCYNDPHNRHTWRSGAFCYNDPHDRHTWRSGVRSAMRAASQLSGRGTTDVDVAPVPAH